MFGGYLCSGSIFSTVLCYKTYTPISLINVGLKITVGCEKISKPTLWSLINVQSVINVQGDKFSKKNKRTGRKSSSIRVQDHRCQFFSDIYEFELEGGRFCSEVRFWQFIIGNIVRFL